MNKYRCVIEFTLKYYKKVEATVSLWGHSKEEVRSLLEKDITMFDYDGLIGQSILHPVVTSVTKIDSQGEL